MRQLISVSPRAAFFQGSLSRPSESCLAGDELLPSALPGEFFFGSAGLELPFSAVFGGLLNPNHPGYNDATRSFGMVDSSSGRALEGGSRREGAQRRAKTCSGPKSDGIHQWAAAVGSSVMLASCLSFAASARSPLQSHPVVMRQSPSCLRSLPAPPRFAPRHVDQERLLHLHHFLSSAVLSRTFCFVCTAQARLKTRF